MIDVKEKVNAILNEMHKKKNRNVTRQQVVRINLVESQQNIQLTEYNAYKKVILEIFRA